MSEPMDPMAEIRASFFVECEELLEALQDGLAQLDDGSDDPETINVVFRAVHSVKGGAGAFGLEALVRFAHRYETVLDEVRGGRLAPDPTAVKLFFQAADQLSDLVRASRDGTDVPEDRVEDLLSRLDALLGDSGPAAEEVGNDDFQPLGVAIDLDLDLPADPEAAIPATSRFVVHFRPHAEMFETGNEPLMLLRNLAALGTAKVTCDASALPQLGQLDPEKPCLAWRVEIETEEPAEALRDVFEFVDGLCDLTVEPAESAAEPSEGASPAAPAPVETTGSEVLPPATEPAAPTLAAPDGPDPADPGPVPAAATPEPAPVSPRAADAPDETGKRAGGSAAAKSVVRVDLERIERLVNLVGELVINQAMLSQSLESAGLSPHSDAMNGLEEFQRLTRDIQDSVMMIRAQPVKSLFQRMSRIVREASAAVGEEVRLVTDGESTEVDKTVIERLADPLTHMIRNAVDHGLEGAEGRAAAGKSAEGVIRLSAAHRSGRVVIEVADDGSGIDRPKVRRIAIDKGLIPPDSQLTDGEIDNLLFLPGFSTAGKVSNLSGRGVGMDVVRNAIQALGGRITTTSVRGRGTTFSISLPLTLAVLDGMVVDVAGETLVLPLNVVVETLSLGRGDVEMLRPGAFVVRVRGGFVPLYDLGVMLGYRGPRDSHEGSIVLLISLDDGTRAALLIDGIQDQRQVVIKGLDDSFYRAPGIAAATILGDGQIALILDPADVIANAGRTRVSEPSQLDRKVDHG